ncbi:hypothetical protein LCGC14_3143350, partial [marine sediment metagenome]
MPSVTVSHRTLSDQHGRDRRRGRLCLPSIPLVVLMLALLSMSAYSKDREDGAQGNTESKTEGKPAGTAEPLKMGGRTFSSDLPLKVLVFREAREAPESIGQTPSARPLDIPRGAPWVVVAFKRVDMEALAREITAKKIPHLVLEHWVVDGDLAHLKDLTGLRWLVLRGCGQITDAGLAHLKGLTGLRKLVLFEMQITGAGLAHLKGLTGLRELHLGGTKITDAGLAHLKGLTGLRELDLGFTKITGAGLAHLNGLTGLRELHLRLTKITDAGLAHLRGLTGLRKLNLEGTKITDAGLAHLKG